MVMTVTDVQLFCKTSISLFFFSMNVLNPIKLLEYMYLDSDAGAAQCLAFRICCNSVYNKLVPLLSNDHEQM